MSVFQFAIILAVLFMVDRWFPLVTDPTLRGVIVTGVVGVLTALAHSNGKDKPKE